MSTLAIMLATFCITVEREPPPEPPPPLAPTLVLESGVFTSNGYSITRTIDSAGNWTTALAHGKLSQEELHKIRDKIATVELTTTPPEKECPATTPVIQLLRVHKGEARFAVLCGPKAHPSVDELLGLVDSLTSRRPTPTVVQVDRWRPGKVALKESIILKRSGSWSTDNGVGHTGGPELEAVIQAFEKVELSAEPETYSSECAVSHIHRVDIPAVGSIKWMEPCQTVSASLAEALHQLRRLVGAN